MGGDTQSHYYISQKATEDIIILGSSRAIHHYIPSILSDSTNMNVYNGGVDGNGIIFLYGRLQLITDRYTPKLIIYDANVNFDIAQNDNLKYLNWLKRFHGSNNQLDSLFYDISHSEKWKLYSGLYKYNSSFIQILSDNISPKQTVLDGGYKPIYGNMNYKPTTKQEAAPSQWDPVKYKYFVKLIQLCRQKNIPLVVSISPMCHATSSDCFQPIKELCQENNIPVIDYYANNEISNDVRYFKDSAHMNHDGAVKFTTAIAPSIKALVTQHSDR